MLHDMMQLPGVHVSDMLHCRVAGTFRCNSWVASPPGIQDCLQGLAVTVGPLISERLREPSNPIHCFRNHLAIICTTTKLTVGHWLSWVLGSPQPVLEVVRLSHAWCQLTGNIIRILVSGTTKSLSTTA